MLGPLQCLRSGIMSLALWVLLRLSFAITLQPLRLNLDFPLGFDALSNLQFPSHFSSGVRRTFVNYRLLQSFSAPAFNAT